MCLLAIAWRQRDDLPLVLAANRDEAYDRAALPPEAFTAGTQAALAPRDLRAGGTWIGIASTGLVVAITNRPDAGLDPRRPSRGALCRTALALPDAGEVRAWIESETRARTYNGFNLFMADRSEAFVASWNGGLQVVSLAPGVHVLTNDHALGELSLPALGEIPWQAPVPILTGALARFLGRHDPEPPQDVVVCKHGDTHGTVSSSLVWLPASAPPWIEHAAGPACRTPFVRGVLPG